MRKTRYRRPGNFRPASILRWGLIAVLVVFGFSFLVRIGDWFKTMKYGGGLAGILDFFGISLSGNDKADIKNIEETEKTLAKLHYAVKQRHRDYATVLARTLEETRPIAAFWTSRVTVMAGVEFVQAFVKFIDTSGVNVQYDKDGNIDTTDPLVVDALYLEFAALYAAYGIRELANRDTPLIGLLFKNTRGTLLQHIIRYLPSSFNDKKGTKYVPSDLASWFELNPYLNTKEDKDAG